jgi:glutathione S-transferase
MELIELHGARHGEPAFARLSLTARVPVLVDDGFALSESSAIVDYLEERYPAPDYPRVLPADLRDRARARQIMAWVRSDVLPLREERPTWRVFYEAEARVGLSPLSPEARRAAAKVIGVAEQIVPEREGPLFGTWCVADTDLAMMLLRLVRTGEAVPARLCAYAEQQWQRPSVRAFVDRPRPPYAPAVLAPPYPAPERAR